MAEPDRQPLPPPPGVPRPRASTRKRRMTLVWLVPLLALAVAGWTFFQTWKKEGPEITITFPKAQGIEPGRTQIQHKGVVLGVVKSIAPSDNFDKVVVTAKMDTIATPFLNEGTKFWVVHPRVTVSGISDLGTLVSGVFIDLDPGPGDEQKNFIGNPDPPTIESQEPGRNFILKTHSLGSLERGSPIYFRGVKVGEVTGSDIDADKSITVNIFIHDQYQSLVQTGTLFWNVSGIGLTAGAEGLRISAQSLQAIVQGGVTFDLPPNEPAGAEAPEGQSFQLFATESAANESVYTEKIRYRLRYTGSIKGLDVGSAVNLLGTRVGQVVNVDLRVDAHNGSALSEVTVEIEPQRIDFEKAGTGSPSASANAGIADRPGDHVATAQAAFAAMAGRNLRAQLASGNLLTGQKVVDFEFIDGAKPAAIVAGTSALPPLFPTDVGNDLDGVMHTANKVLDDADHFINTTGPAVKPLLESLQGTAQSLQSTADQINTNDGNGGLSGTLDELKQAAQSIRTLATDLDANPQSLIFGRKDDQ